MRDKEIGYCFRRRNMFGIVYGGASAFIAFALLDPWIQQPALYRLVGVAILSGSVLFTINYFGTSRICVGRLGLRRVEWLGLITNDIPFSSLRRIDLATRPSVPTLANVVEIHTQERTIVLDRRSYGDEGTRKLLMGILEHCPDAAFTNPARGYVGTFKRKV